jgi:hypothetical protein
MFFLIRRHYIKGKHNKGIGLWSHDKARAPKGGMRIGKTTKKLDSSYCPQCRETKSDTLKWLKPTGEGNQELERKVSSRRINLEGNTHAQESNAIQLPV